jgi:hypothetical protein
LLDQSNALGGWVAQRLPNDNTQYGDTDTSIASATSGRLNCALGGYALYSIGQGTGSYNVAVGSAIRADVVSAAAGTLGQLKAGSYNTATGYGALKLLSGAASYNTATGAFALPLAGPASQYNTGIGYNAGYNTATTQFSGINSCFLGANTSYTTEGAAANYSTAIGSGATMDASHQIVLGTAAEYVYIPGTADATDPSVGGGRGVGTLVVAGGGYFGGNLIAHGNTTVYGNTMLSGNLTVFSNTIVYGNTMLYGNCSIGNTIVSGNALVNNVVVGNLVVNSVARFRQVVSTLSTTTYKVIPEKGIYAFYMNVNDYVNSSSRCWLDVLSVSLSGTNVSLYVDNLPTTINTNYYLSLVINGASVVNTLNVRFAGASTYQLATLYCGTTSIGSVSVTGASYVDQRIHLVVGATAGTLGLTYTKITPLY